MSRRLQVSAGILPFRRRGELQVLLGHPGGPYWARKDAGAWTIPKGLVDPGEDLLATALREFTEETGFSARGPFIPLSPVKQKSGKTVHAFACEGDFDPAKLVVQHVRNRMAAEVRQAQEFCGNRSSRMVRADGGARENHRLSEAAPG